MSNPILDHINLNGVTYDIVSAGAIDATLISPATLELTFSNQIPSANGNDF